MIAQAAVLARLMIGQRGITITLWLAWAWCVMTLTHELGHVIAGTLSGGQLVGLELRPWRLPHSLFVADPTPWVTLWAGPVIGSAAPLLTARWVDRPGIWFVGWFCLLANASYLWLGYLSRDALLDTARMIAAGVHPAVVLVVSTASLAVGYAKFRQRVIDLFSGLTPPMTSRACWISTTGLASLLIVQTFFGVWLSR